MNIAFDVAGKNAVVINSILVIDDHPLYCDALAATLGQIFEAKKIKKANSLSEGLKVVGSRFCPDLVILDLKLPDVTGISGLLKIKSKLRDVPILVTSAESSNRIIQALMSAGAAGFIPKDASHTVLQKALTDIRDGKKYLPDGYKPSSQPAQVDFSSKQIAQKIADLTPQQSRIMKLICAGKPNKLIAYELSLAEATVKAHITALLRRLGVNNRTQAALLVKSASLENPSDISEADIDTILS